MEVGQFLLTQEGMKYKREGLATVLVEAMIASPRTTRRGPYGVGFFGENAKFWAVVLHEVC